MAFQFGDQPESNRVKCSPVKGTNRCRATLNRPQFCRKALLFHSRVNSIKSNRFELEADTGFSWIVSQDTCPITLLPTASIVRHEVHIISSLVIFFYITVRFEVGHLSLGDSGLGLVALFCDRIFLGLLLHDHSFVNFLSIQTINLQFLLHFWCDKRILRNGFE